MAEVSYPIGVDCMWIGLDRNNHVGVFITAGIGPIPVAALSNDIVAFENIENNIFDLPIICKSELLISLPRPDDFLAIAERGLFVYDWRDLHRTSSETAENYELIAMPKQPIAVGSLPSLIEGLSRKVIFNSIVFYTAKSLDICGFFSCKRGIG